MIDEQRYRELIQQLATGGITGNKTYHQYRDQYIPRDSESMDYAHGGGVGSMMQPKNKISVQGGVRNYLGNQEEVKAPLNWQSGPDHPSTELAYITQKEKDLLVKKDLHGSLNGGVNRGPAGIISLNGWGSTDPGQNVSGAAASAAESGRNTSDTLAAGMSAKDVQDFRSAAINAGAGQRVNPGFFDSSTHLDADEIARAKAYRQNPANRFANQAYKNTGQTGIMNMIKRGGFFGNLIRSLGQKFGLGKTYDQPTYDMSEGNTLGLGGVDPFANLDIRDKFNRKNINIVNKDIVPLEKPTIEIEENIDVFSPEFDNAMAKLNTFESREYNNLLAGKENGFNSPKQNERLQELENKKNEAALNTNTTAIV